MTWLNKELLVADGLECGFMCSLNDHNWANGHSWIRRGQIRTVIAEAKTRDFKLGLLYVPIA